MATISESVTLEGREYGTQIGTILTTHIGLDEHNELIIELSCAFPGTTLRYTAVGDNAVAEEQAGHELMSIMNIGDCKKWDDLKGEQVIGLFASSRDDWYSLVGIGSLDGQRFHFPGRSIVQGGTFMALGLSPKPGDKITTASTLSNADGMFIALEYLTARQPSTEGVIASVVSSKDESLWFVKHTDGKLSVYGIWEMSPSAS